MKRAKPIPRIEDLPYSTSPPIQYVYESSAILDTGVYRWNDRPQPLTPDRPVRENTLYFFRNITMSADITEADYAANILATAEFRMFRVADSQAVLFREPVRMAAFFRPLDYRYAWKSSRGDDQLLAGFTGTVLQGPGLVGRVSVTLKAVITAQEVSDDSFVNLFFNGYPRPVEWGTE